MTVSSISQKKTDSKDIEFSEIGVQPTVLQTYVKTVSDSDEID